MKHYFFLGCILALYATGCAGPTTEPAKTQPLAVAPSGGWPACPVIMTTQESAVSMNDTKLVCSSCDLVAPCVNKNSITYKWYSPKICALCASNCLAGTAVGDFCTTYYGGQCTAIVTAGNNTYPCQDGRTFDAATHAAYGAPVNAQAYCGGRYTSDNDIVSNFQSCTAQ